jgi:hypothetical protein
MSGWLRILLKAFLIAGLGVDSLAAEPVGIAFSPSGGATELVVRTIESAKKSVRVAAYSFTSKPTAQALL